MTLTINGALVATTTDIMQIKRRDDEAPFHGADYVEREHMPSWRFIQGLDPDGFHILCTRAEGLPGLFEDPEDGKQGWSGELTLGSYLHFEGLFKMKGQKAPTQQWITLTVHEASQLEPAPATAPALVIRAIDGETQVR